jgi:hypothetical protein
VLPNLTATAYSWQEKERKKNGKGKSPAKCERATFSFDEGQSKRTALVG